MPKYTKSFTALLIALIVAVGYVSMPAAASGTVLFSDDFSAGLGNWVLDTTTDGRPDYFQIDDGTLLFAPVSFGNIFTGDPAWTDYSVEVEFEVLEFGQYGSFRVFTRANRLWNGYAATVFPTGMTLYRFDGDWDLNAELAKVEMDVPVETRLVVRVEVKGNQLSVYLDDELIAETEDEANRYADGGIGLRPDNSSVRVYGVTVKQL